MPDFSMCDAECSSSRLCRRHADSGTKPCDWQPYTEFKPDGDGQCGFYMPLPVREEATN